ncbi:MAG: hypothetical protein SNJ71_08465, partial [Bacteroidales bacterium]
IGQIITDSFSILFRNNAKLLLIVFIIIFPVWILSAYYQLSLTKVIITDNPPSSQVLFYTFMFYLTFITSKLLLILIVNFYIKQLKDNNQEPVLYNDIWNNIKSSFFPMFGVFFGIMTIILLSFLLLIIPGIIALVIFSIVFPVIIFEKKSFAEAGMRCIELIKDNWFSTFFLIIAVIVLSMLLSYLLAIPFFLNKGVSYHGVLYQIPLWGSLGERWDMAIEIFFYSIINITSIISETAIVLQYFNLKEKHKKKTIVINHKGDI